MLVPSTRASNSAVRRFRAVWALSWTIKIAAAVLFFAVLIKVTGG